jgi:hypothetical protein
VEWSWTAWAVSVAAVVVSAVVAWREGSWTRRPGLDMGFVNHGGMWGDLLLLPVANAVIVPHLTNGWWMAGAIAMATAASLLVHVHWYRGAAAAHSREHMWPARTHGSWAHDLSMTGWLHVVYVVGELALLIGFLIHPVPADVIVLVVIVFMMHVPIGLLQPRYFLSGRVATLREQRLLIPCMLALWAVALLKM